MKIIAGLGNPGEKYSNTRHNIGFMVITELAKRFRNVNRSYKFDGLLGDFFFGGEKVLIFQPMKYMNKSGAPLGKVMDYFDLKPQDLLVVHDDLDLDLGKMKFKRNGSSGGHNGIKSIITKLGTQDFKRLKIGIDRPPANLEAADYVLTKFRSEEKEVTNKTIEKAVMGIELFLNENIQQAMNKYNGQ